MKVYSYNNQLVAILKETPETVTFITASGDIKEIPQSKAIVEEAKLITAGVYNDKFIQAALGGLVSAPKYIKKTGGLMLYVGKHGIAYVEPQGKGLVKYAIGVDSGAFVNPEEVNKKKIPHGKEPDWDKDKLFKEDMRKDNGKGGKNTKKPMDEIDDLESMDSSVPETLDIADPNEQLGQVKSIVLKWDSPKIDGSIEDIKSMFGEGKPLPEPTSIVIDTGEERITSKKTLNTASIQERIKTARSVGAPGLGLTPTMSHTCPKCQSLLMYKWDPQKQETLLVCPVCGYTERYERDEETQRTIPIEKRETN